MRRGGVAIAVLAVACGRHAAERGTSTFASPSGTHPGVDASAGAPAPAAPEPPDPALQALNLDFEKGDGLGGWSGDGAADTAEKHGGAHSLRLSKSGTASISAPIGSCRGKRLRITGWMKTHGVSEWAGLWVRAEGNGNGAVFEDQRRRGRGETQDWTQVEVTLFVPHEAERLVFGATLVGGGTAWFDDLVVTVDGEREQTIDNLSLRSPSRGSSSPACSAGPARRLASSRSSSPHPAR